MRLSEWLSETGLVLCSGLSSLELENVEPALQEGRSAGEVVVDLWVLLRLCRHQLWILPWGWPLSSPCRKAWYDVTRLWAHQTTSPLRC